MALTFLACLMMVPGRAVGAESDDFESYDIGSNLHGQGNWAGWAGDPSAGALVSGDFSFSPTRSVNITGPTDLVRTFSGATNGHWVFSVMQYIPSASSGTSYVILLNTYRPPYQAADLNWSVQIQCDMTGGQVISDLGGGAALPMIKDRWVEVRCEVNLASNSVSEFYNGQLLSTHAWQGNSGTPGLNEIQALDLYANNVGPVYYDALNLTEHSVIIRVETGRRSQGCTGFGICSITFDPLAGVSSIPAAATWANGRLLLNFLADPPSKTNVLTIDEDIVLDSATSRALGYEHVTVHAGLYPVDYSRNPYGEVSPDVTAQGVIVTIEIGRLSKGCTGFGICSITIDVSLSARAVPAAATWHNGRLLLNYLAEPPDKTNVLVLEDDVVLDSATSRALGYEHVTLRAGQYPVDYSVNPHGQVSPDVTAQGLIIWVQIGIRTTGSCIPTFGICAVGMGNPPFDRAVQAAASLNNGKLRLSFLTEPPDKTNLLTIPEDLVLDSATARRLGYEQMIVRAGQYPVDNSDNPHGEVNLVIELGGLVITVEIGRGTNCQGFGICSLSIEPSASTRAVPTVASWENSRLQFSFLSEPPDKTNVLVLDEDLVLDSATSRALGYEHITLRAGHYPVDFSVNPHGQVSPDVTTQGLIIWVKIGLPKAGGCVPGFGICGIGTGNPPLDRAVPAAATIVNGCLRLSLLSNPPDKTNVLTLEQDIVLDSATARRLGYGQMTLKAGQYPMDDSDNPHGDFRIIVIDYGIIVITIETGRGTNCQGFGICSLTVESILLRPRSVPATAEWVNGRLQLNYLAEPPDKANVLVLDNDVVLDSATSRALGYEHVTLRAGQYPVDFSVNPHGQVSPDVITQGIIITIDCTRRCVSGFGFCSITIDASTSKRAVPTAATWVNGRLQLGFLTEPPDKANVLVLDEDIVLDTATSRALGYEQVTLRAGQYPVDFSVNPHGQVSPDVLTRGLNITIQIYRRNAGAPCTKGFGLCGIVIEIPYQFDARDVPTAAEWVNGRLQLNFLADPPDKTNVWTVDQDVVLDTAISRPLGYEQVIIRAGQYPVDYSRNPFGQVSPDTSAQGLTIWVQFGLRSLAACRT